MLNSFYNWNAITRMKVQNTQQRIWTFAQSEVVTEPKYWKEKCSSAFGLQILDSICSLTKWLMWNLELDSEILFPFTYVGDF